MALFNFESATFQSLLGAANSNDATGFIDDILLCHVGKVFLFGEGPQIMVECGGQADKLACCIVGQDILRDTSIFMWQTGAKISSLSVLVAQSN